MLLAIDIKYAYNDDKNACAAQVAIVNEELKCIYKSCIKNYNTCLVHLSVGSNNTDGQCNAMHLLQVQDDVLGHLQTFTVVGSYGVHFNLKPFKIKPSEVRVCDISQLPPFKNDGPVTLEFFAKKYLGINLLYKKYDPEERAICIMQLCKNFISKKSAIWK